MGTRTDHLVGRAKQALGAITGNEKMKRRGQRQEDKGKFEGDLKDRLTVSDQRDGPR